MLILHSNVINILAPLTGFQYDLIIIRKWIAFWATLYKHHLGTTASVRCQCGRWCVPASEMTYIVLCGALNSTNSTGGV